MKARSSDLVLVGVDQTPGARAALRFALQEAEARGCAVEVVTAWLWSSPFDGMEHVGTLAEGQAAAEALQQRVLSEELSSMPVAPVVSRTVVHDYAGKTLVTRSESATVLVVGSGRRSGLSRALLGSVSEYCVRHAPVPVVVVPDPGAVVHHVAPHELQETTGVVDG